LIYGINAYLTADKQTEGVIYAVGDEMRGQLHKVVFDILSPEDEAFTASEYTVID
jgi:hypothetical protein